MAKEKNVVDEVVDAIKEATTGSTEVKLVIGLDPGTNTGLCVWDCSQEKLLVVTSVRIDEAMQIILRVNPALVRVEDARKRTWFGDKGVGVLQGAGSVKRDCRILEGFLKKNKIPYEMVAPKFNTTKLSAKDFAYRTGWTKRTNEHGRDAAGLVVAFTERNLHNTLNLIKK